ncbi:type II toxin-antitoxin system MqsR family toxin [Azospirillum endophyticum]
MEKRRPTYDLNAFKAAMTAPNGLAITKVALQDAAALGFTRSDIVATIAGMGSTHFVKSMTSHGDHKEWQDVYVVPAKGMMIYTKFRGDTLTVFRVLSFKERG